MSVRLQSRFTTIASWLAVPVLLASVPAGAQAASSRSTMGVSAIVLPSCSVSTANPSSPLINCTNGTNLPASTVSRESLPASSSSATADSRLREGSPEVTVLTLTY